MRQLRSHRQDRIPLATLERLDARRLLCVAPEAGSTIDLDALLANGGHITMSMYERLTPAEQARVDLHRIEDDRPIVLPDAPATFDAEAVVLPDLVVLTGSGYLQPYIDTTEIPGRNLMRFATAIGNMGAAPAILSSQPAGAAIPAGAPITSWVNPDGTQNILQHQYSYNPATNSFAFTGYRAAGRMVYHSNHGHFHLEDYAVYRLRHNVNGQAGDVVLRGDGSEAIGDKIGFCLINVGSSFTLPNGSSSTTLPGYSAVQPSTGCGFLQGIHVGRRDVYADIYDGQWIDVTGVPNGSYFLEVTIDASDVIEESDDANNTVLVPVTLNANPPVGGIQPDRFEPNNAFDSATDLGELGVQTQNGLTIHTTNEDDYFRVVAASTGNYAVRLNVGNRDVNLYVYDAARNLLASSTSASNGPMTESVNVDFVRGQEYFVVARGFGSATGTSGVSSSYAVDVRINPTVSAAVDEAVAREAGAAAGTFVLARNGPFSSALDVNFSISGSATRGVDYDLFFLGALVSGNAITIGVEALTAEIQVVPLGDGDIEPTETIELAVLGGAYVVEGGASGGVVELRDAPPVVVDSGYLIGEARNRLGVQFSLDVGASLSIADLTVTSLAEGAPVDVIGLSYDAATRRAVFTLADAALGAGDYRATLSGSGVTHALGAPLDADHVIDFFVLDGDINRDRTVDAADLGVLAVNWLQSGKAFAEGDLNYDGVVDVADLGILATNWQGAVAAPGIAGAEKRPASPFADRRIGLKLARLRADDRDIAGVK